MIERAAGFAGLELKRPQRNASHPENLTPSRQGHSVGWYEGDTLVIDTVGIKVAPFSTVDAFGTPHSSALLYGFAGWPHLVKRGCTVITGWCTD